MCGGPRRVPAGGGCAAGVGLRSERNTVPLHVVPEFPGPPASFAGVSGMAGLAARPSVVSALAAVAWAPTRVLDYESVCGMRPCSAALRERQGPSVEDIAT